MLVNPREVSVQAELNSSQRDVTGREDFTNKLGRNGR